MKKIVMEIRDLPIHRMGGSGNSGAAFAAKTVDFDGSYRVWRRATLRELEDALTKERDPQRGAIVGIYDEKEQRYLDFKIQKDKSIKILPWNIPGHTHDFSI